MALVPNLPDTTLAYQRKYGNPQTLQYLSQLSPATRNALIQYDQDRALRGARPLSERETLLATTAAETGQAVTQPREQGGISGFLGNVWSNANAILGSIPKLPLGVYREFQDVRNLPDQFRRVIRDSDGNPLETLSGIAGLPGVRMLPGAYIAENITDPGELLDNPLFTALDIAPGARVLGKQTRVGRAAMAQGARGPFRALATRRLDEAGELVPNRLGEATQSATSAMGRTRPGQIAQSMFGPDARAMARLEAEHTMRLREYLDPDGKVSPDDPLLVHAVRKNAQITSEFDKSGLSKARQSEIIHEIQHEPHKMAAYGDLENAFVDRFRELNDTTRALGITDQQLAEAVIGGTTEIYDTPTAKKLLRTQRTGFNVRAHATARSHILEANAGNLDIDRTLNHIHDVVDNRIISAAQRKSIVEGDLVALYSNGSIDLKTFRQLRKELRRTRAENLGDYSFRQLATLNRDPIPVRQRINQVIAQIDETPGYLNPNLRTVKLRDAVRRGDYAEAYRLSRQMRGVKRYAELDLDQLSQDLMAVRVQQKYLADTNRYTQRLVDRVTKQEQTAIGQSVPGRFQPLVDKKFEELVDGKIRELYSTDPKIDEYLQLARERNYALIEGMTDRDFRTLQREAKATWLEMKEAGIDPIFVHRVRPDIAKSLEFIKVTDRPRTPSQVKQRMGDLSTFSDDASLILTHQGMEWLARRGSQAFVDEIGSKFGRTRREVTQDYLAAARRRAGNDPMKVQDELTRMMEKEWVTFPPDHLQGYGRARASATTSGDQVMIPRHAAKVMEQLYDAPLKGLTAATDPIMNAFRTSLLPLSPRWHINNILSGLMLLPMRTGLSVFKYGNQARKMLKERAIPEGIGAGQGGISAPADFAELAKRGNTVEKLLDHLDAKSKTGAGLYAGSGATLRRMWDSTETGRKWAQSAIQGSYSMNQWFDDLYRTMAYLYGHDKALTKGMTQQAARQSGITLARKILQSWDEMTPLERTIMRNVFPFYGWMSHIARYVLTYPADHPVRTAIFSSFARNELEDLGTGLPQEFAKLFYWGDMNDQGEITAINVGGANPFADVANMFTLEGFTGNAAPLISASLQMMGVDPSTGSTELYPTLRYDPETGRMIAERPSFLTTFAEAIVPQTRIVTNMTGMSSEIRDLMAYNPDSARRYLQSTLGLPVVTRRINLPQEQFKTELRREREQREQWNAALRSGDMDAAREYPGLRALVEQVEVLRGQGALDQFVPDRDNPGHLALLRQAATLGMMG